MSDHTLTKRGPEDLTVVRLRGRECLLQSISDTSLVNYVCHLDWRDAKHLVRAGARYLDARSQKRR